MLLARQWDFARENCLYCVASFFLLATVEFATSMLYNAHGKFWDDILNLWGMTRTEDERCKHTIFIVSLDLIAGKQLKLPWISFQLLITRVRTSSCWRTHRGIVAGIIGVKEGIDHLGVSFRFYNSSSMSMILLISYIICFPLRGKDWGANGHWIEFLQKICFCFWCDHKIIQSICLLSISLHKIC